MKSPHTLFGLFAIILLVVVPYAENGFVIQDDGSIRNDIPNRDATAIPLTTDRETTSIGSSSTATTMVTSDVTSTTTTTVPVPTTTTTIPVPTTTTTIPVPTTTTTIPVPTTTAAPVITTTITVSTSTATTETSPPIISTTTAVPATTAAPDRKFDGLSFFGGMILATGLGVIIYFIVRYFRRNNRLPYSHIR